MSALRELARPMLASIFVVQGVQSYQDPERVSLLAEPVVARLRERMPAIPAETEHAVRINGAIQAAAGALLGLGLLPRLAAMAIAGSLVPTTLAGHRFWESKDPQERAMQRIQFLKNLTIMGGLLLAIADTGGSPSFAWRRRHARKVAHSLTQTLSDAATTFADAAHAAATSGAH